MKPADFPPLPPRSRWVDPVWPLESALATTRRLLFQPFDLRRWLMLGLLAWLSGLTSIGTTTGIQSQANRSGTSATPTAWNASDILWEANSAVRRGLDAVQEHWLWMVPLIAFVAILALTVWVGLTWLSSRGDLLFVAGVTRPETDLPEPWHEFSREANSLFRFRLVLELLGPILLLMVLGFEWLLVSLSGSISGISIAWIVLLLIPVVMLALALWLVGWLTTEFVVPIQFLRRCGCRKAWGILLGQMVRFPTSFLLYGLVQVPLNIVTALAVVVFAILTCGACCLLLVPFANVVILLPLHVFYRAYPLHFLAQFGPGWDAFQAGGPKSAP
ncbi:MAG: hypothetical protein ACKPAH_14950 [Verrucomicrobiota bacterium]